MEAPNNNEVETREQKLRRYVVALETLEAKYRRGEVELNSVVYAMNELQSVFFSELQAKGIISADVNYRDLYRSALTDDGHHYTEILSNDNEVVTEPKTPEQKVIDLISKIGSILPAEVVQSALDKARNQDITEEDLNNLLSDLLSQAFAKLNRL